MPVMTFPPGLLEAAADGERDAFIDLGEYLKERGDVRWMDLAWRIQHGIKPDYSLRYHTCPKCGSFVSTYDIRNGRYSCDDAFVKWEDGQYAIGEKCDWEGAEEELIPPLIKE